MSKKIGRMFLGAAAAAACLFVGGAAQGGVVFRGSFDPIDFMGIAEFDVDPGCIQANGYSLVPSCGSVVILSASVTDLPPPTDTDSITFAPPPFTSSVNGLLWSGGNLIGVDSDIIGTGTPSTGLWFDPLKEYGLEFVSGFLTQGSPVVNLWWCKDGCGFTALLPEGTALDVTFVRVTDSVPEPASLGLVLGALGAGWLARRRKAKA